jgi:photosystem II stability/assembly factor-like uncharacterized protein/uncharacterized protein GlcG (DUF336 family)
MNLRNSTTFLCLLFAQITFGQNWLDLKEQGANYYQIKDAFEQEYTPARMKEISKELRKEMQKPGRETDKFEKEMEGVIHFKRWSHWIEPRVRESGGRFEMVASGIERAIADQKRAVNNRTGASWSHIGPKSTAVNGGNGRVNAIRVDPTNTNNVFACSPAGGLWKSTTGGSSWTALSDGIAVLGATDVAFDPTNVNTMYLLTGDGEAGDAVSTGVYKSTNGGATWSPTGLTFTMSTRRLLSKILINPSSGAIIVGGSAGIYRSLDGGATWTQTSTKSVRDLEFQPGNPSVVFAGGYAANGLCRSADGGVTWTNVASIPTSGIIRTAVAVTALDPNYVYCLVGNSTDYGYKGVYLSTNGGLTFTLQSSTPNILGWNAAGNDAGGQAWYDLAIAVDPSVKTTIYTGGVNIWKSTNSGAAFTCVAQWAGSGAPYVHADIHDLMFAGSTLWAANDGGVFCSVNGGSTWSDKSSNLPIAQMYGFGQSTTNASRLIGGQQDNGTNLTTNGGTSFTQVLGGDGMLCFIDRTNDNNVFASIYYGDLYRSTNGGTAFSYIYTVPGGDWVTPWMQDPSVATTIYAGGTNVYKSTDNGTSWASISASLAIGTILQMDVAPSNNQCIIASSSTRVMKSANGGTSWTEISAGLPTGIAIQSVRFSLTNPNKIYVCYASYAGASIYCSTNGGTTWTSLSTGLPSIPVNCMAFQSNGDMYCGTDLGVYLRTASATTWTAFTTGMPGVAVTDLDIFTPTSKLRASTYGRGIWESPLNSVNAPPSVSLTSPTNNATFAAPATVSITATAADNDGTVTKVEFFNGATLLGTSTTTPYGFTWSNVASGSYTLTAKATDNSGNVTTSTAVAINVTIQNDAGISAIIAPAGSINVAAVTPSVTLKNFGTNAITSAQILSKVDANANTIYNWTGTLAAGATVNVSLPAITSYSSATHSFTATIGTVNGLTDANAANNSATSSFTYSSCSNDNETANNSATTAPTLALNTAKNSQIGSSTDLDYYKFTTTTASPKLKITLSNLPADYDLRLYKALISGAIGSQIAVSQLGGLTTESIIYNTPTAGATYYVRINGYNNAFSTAGCYNLLAQTSNLTFTNPANRSILIDKADLPADAIEAEELSVYPNPAHDIVNIKFIAEEKMEYKLTVINAVGKTVSLMSLFYEQGENFTTIPTDEFSQGIYFIKLSNGKASYTQKLIIE